MDHFLLAPSNSTDNYQKVRPFAIHRKNITTSALTNVNTLSQEICMGETLSTFIIHQNLKEASLPPNRKI
jgi:hypothetical protein